MAGINLERVARAICEADGKNPDALIPTGRLETVRVGDNSFTQEEVAELQWKQYEREARKHIAAQASIFEQISEGDDTEPVSSLL